MNPYQKKAADLFIIFMLVLITGGGVCAQTPGISFLQGEIVPLKKGKKDYYQVDLKNEAFTIVFPGKELHVCAGTEEELFKYTQAGTDINADFNSYFFIFKYLAGSEDTDYLSIEKNTANTLNETHGAKPGGDGLYQFTVRSLLNDGEQQQLSDFKALYLALWLDKNKDQYIDKEEILRVRANIQ